MNIAKLLLLLTSLVFSIAILELGLRLAFHPRDYLAPELAYDDVLGFRIVPGSGGHDGWGFRNGRVPEDVDVVALGDSMTWGVAALADESWPSWLERMTGRSVYNLGVGGYGPAEYLHLLETKALSLDPELVVVGWYLGNDQVDAYRSVARSGHWVELRRDSMGPWVEGASDAVPTIAPVPGHPIVRARDWLRQNSMLFRAIESSSLGQLLNAFSDRRAGLSGDGCSVSIEGPFPTVIQAESRHRFVDLDSVRVREGVELGLAFIDRIKALADEHGVSLQVVVLPMKETVVAGPLEDVEDSCWRTVQRSIESEAVIRARVLAHLERRGIPYVDPLDRMRRAAGSERLYLRSADSHPNGRGYELISEEVVEQGLR